MMKFPFVTYLPTFLVCAVMLVLGYQAFFQFRAFEREVQSNYRSATLRNEALGAIRDSLVYGRDYSQSSNIDKQLADTLAAIDRYQGIDGADRASASQLGKAVKAYAKNDGRASATSRSGIDVAQSDQGTKIDSPPAIAALKKMEAREAELRAREGKTIKDNFERQLLYISLGLGLVPLIIILNFWMGSTCYRLRDKRLSTSRIEIVNKIIHMLPVAMLVVRDDGTILFGNYVASKILHYDEGELEGMKLEELLPQRYRHGHVALRQGFFNDRDRFKGKEVAALTGDGREMQVGVSLAKIAVSGRDLTVACIRDISKQRRVEEELQQRADKFYDMAHRDQLTGVANRRHFDEYLEMQCRASAIAVSPLTLLLIDVDEFKKYNDYYGHRGGDDCLQQLAGVLQSTLHRAGDVLARYGGEEFGCILPGVGNEEALQLAERMITAVRSAEIPHAWSGVSSCVTISIGVCTAVRAKDMEPENLVEAADRQLYEVKHRGRNGVLAVTL